MLVVSSHDALSADIRLCGNQRQICEVETIFECIFVLLYCSDTGLFGVYVSTEPENAKPMLKLIGQELAAMSSPTYITEEVLELAKTQVKVNLMAALDSSAMVSMQRFAENTF
jgi:predicted Zn-dependent peptidase